MDTQNKTTTFLSNTLIALSRKITSVLDVPFLKNMIGEIPFQYLLTYIIGLIVMDDNHTATAMAERLRLCAHDTLRNTLCSMSFPLGTLMKMFVRVIRAVRRAPGWLVLDDTPESKKFSKKIECAGYAYCASEGRVVMGIHFVTLYWTDGYWKLPVGFRLWRPKDKTRNYETKIDLALRLLVSNLELCRTCEYLVFDGWYLGKRFLRMLKSLNISCVSSLAKSRNVVFKEQKMRVSSFRQGDNEIVYLPGFGDVALYCTKIGKRLHYLISTDITVCAKEVKKRYKNRWPVEEFFRCIKQCLGLEGCQCRKNKAVVNHITLVFIAYVALEILSKQSNCNPYQMKRMLQNEFYGFSDEFPNLRQRREFFKLAA